MLYIQLKFCTSDLGVLVLFLMNINCFVGLCVEQNEHIQFLLACCWRGLNPFLTLVLLVLSLLYPLLTLVSLVFPLPHLNLLSYLLGVLSSAPYFLLCHSALECSPFPSRCWLWWPPLVGPFPYCKQVQVFCMDHPPHRYRFLAILFLGLNPLFS